MVDIVAKSLVINMYSKRVMGPNLILVLLPLEAVKSSNDDKVMQEVYSI